MAAERLTGPAARAAEDVARASYGRLVAVLAARTGDLALAEDCLAAAFEEALRRWPDRGVPRNPEGWLLTVARNRRRDAWRSAYHRGFVPLTEALDEHTATDPLEEVEPDGIGDRRLELLFACAHPAVAPAVRTPLMLQVVLGVDAARIAAAFAVPPSAMAQRLVRAKRRIRDARVPFALPGRDVVPERLPAVLEAVYGCYAVGWPDDGGHAGSLAAEARHLAVTLATLLRTEPEAWGLAALTTLALARAAPPGATFVPLEEQDPTAWDPRLIREGEVYLRRATGADVPGRFQLEAAVQAVHCDRRRTGRTDWAALRTLYSALVVVAPTLGARVARAAVVGRTDGAEAGLAALEEITATGADVVARFQPFHATRAELLAHAGHRTEAAAAYRTAAGLSAHPEVRAHLLRRAAAP